MPHATSTSNTVQTTLNYHLEPSKGGKNFWYAGTVSDKRRKHVPVPATITDMRGHEDDFSVDKQGFQVVNSATVMNPNNNDGHEFGNDEKVKQVYYKECADLFKNVTGASRVHVMSHIVRSRSWDAVFESEKDADDMAKTAPTNVRFVHVDQSPAGALSRLQEHLPEEWEDLTKHRYAIINVWRPIRTVTRDALAMCDARSIPDENLREVTARFGKGQSNSNGSKDRTEDTGNVPATSHETAYDKAYALKTDIKAYEIVPPEPEGMYEWYYASALQPDEALLLKIFDSTTREGVAKRSPHTSFQSEDGYGPPRESLEVRCYVFWDDQD